MAPQSHTCKACDKPVDVNRYGVCDKCNRKALKAASKVLGQRIGPSASAYGKWLARNGKLMEYYREAEKVGAAF